MKNDVTTTVSAQKRKKDLKYPIGRLTKNTKSVILYDLLKIYRMNVYRVYVTLLSRIYV